MKNFKKLLYLLTSRERKEAIIMLIMIIIVALSEMISITSILPFMAVLTDPSIIETNIYLNKFFQFIKVFGVENNDEFLLALGTVVLILIFSSIFLKAFSSYLQIRFVLKLEYKVGKRLFERYLNQPYGWFLNINSADLGRTILSETGQVIVGGIKTILDLIAKGVLTISIMFLLIIANPKLASIIGLSLTIFYLTITFLIKNLLKKIGKKRFENNKYRFKIASEAFNAVKEIKVRGLEKIFVDIFSGSAKVYAQTQSSASIIREMPRYILEIIAFSGILSIIFFAKTQSGSYVSVLPIISLYIFAGYRLMPALQTMYAAFSQITFIGPAIDKIYNDLKTLKLSIKNQHQKFLSFEKSITLSNIFYSYPNSQRTALKGINLQIPAKSKIAFVGETGCGKTTTVDIILGLLDPQKGSLKIDDTIITKQNLSSWQFSIGYVPQNIFLDDDSVAGNIAFGVDHKNIDHDAVEKVSKIANLHEFVVNELPNQYEEIIGERGIRLSGGQRQRIGIARALYHNPKLLILDEATSALDNKTEKKVMDEILNLDKNITIIIISHRLNTVKDCDIIFKFQKGELVSQGTFDEVI